MNIIIYFRSGAPHMTLLAAANVIYGWMPPPPNKNPGDADDQFMVILTSTGLNYITPFQVDFAIEGITVENDVLNRHIKVL